MKTHRSVHAVLPLLMPLLSLAAFPSVTGAETPARTAVGAGIIAQEDVNLFKNAEFQFDDDAKLLNWNGNGQFSQDVGFKGTHSVRITLNYQAADFIQNYMTQIVKDLQPGKYIFTAYIKLDRKISDVVLLRFFTLDGEVNYQGPHLKASAQPEPGEWGKVMAEFDIPEVTDSATFALDFRDATPGATVWVDSPILIYKAGQ